MAKRRQRTGNPLLAVGYLRVSTDDQNLSPKAQRAALDRWCRANGAALVAIYEDHGVSGGAPLEKRPALMEALDALVSTGAGVLLVAKRDRLARDVVMAAMIERLAQKNGACVTTADGVGNGDGPEAGLMRGIVDLFAQYERALVRARTRAALAVKAARGERTGNVPYGYRLNAEDVRRRLTDPSHAVRLDVDAQEQAVIACVRAAREQGASLRGIVAELAAAGVVGRTGRPLALTQVRNLLRGERPALSQAAA